MLTCDLCGNQLKMDGSREFATCISCGMRYERDALQSMRAQEQSVAAALENGQARADQLAANAEQFMEQKEYEKAEKGFHTLAEQYPQDWRGWWGLFLVQMETLRFSGIYDFVENEKYAQNAFATAGAKLDVLTKQYDQAWGRLEKVFTSGESRWVDILISLLPSEKEGDRYTWQHLWIDKYRKTKKIECSAKIGDALLAIVQKGKENADLLADIVDLKKIEIRNSFGLGKHYTINKDDPINDAEHIFLEYIGVDTYRKLEAWLTFYLDSVFDRCHPYCDFVLCYERLFVVLDRGIFCSTISNRAIDYNDMDGMKQEQKRIRRERYAQGKCPFCDGNYKKSRCSACKISREEARKAIQN